MRMEFQHLTQLSPRLEWQQKQLAKREKQCREKRPQKSSSSVDDDSDLLGAPSIRHPRFLPFDHLSPLPSFPRSTPQFLTAFRWPPCKAPKLQLGAWTFIYGHYKKNTLYRHFSSTVEALIKCLYNNVEAF
uniref:Uncharacterized protein n=1 Tax=Oryza sativa subsp. japonica TaxID=39947 RepID=Q6ETF8_ORYSJ|nr:hypothetical protein [Oryza sativa Japonica Group]